MTEKIASSNDHNVYILGAGFSCEAGMPLVANYLHRMRDAAPWLVSEGRSAEAKAIGSVLQFRHEASSAAYRISTNPENIEELFSLASACKSDKSLVRDFTVALAATLDYCANQQEGASLFLDAPATWNPPSHWKKGDRRGVPEDRRLDRAPVHDIYAGLLCGHISSRSDDARDTFISFNYDTLVEESLSNCELTFSYGFARTAANIDGSLANKRSFDTEAAVRVLKLHGSVNWAKGKGTTKKVTVFGGYEDLRKADREPVILPPTWKKEFPALLTQVWDTAVEAIRTATRVIVIGFSIPVIDTHFKYLLAAGLKDNISLRDLLFVNPNIDLLRERLETLVRPELEEHGVLRVFKGKTLDFFCRDKSDLRSIGREPEGQFRIKC
ncbi:MAG: hypothetical protein ACE5FA_10530 [Dehalococcoidia bacterium]